MVDTETTPETPTSLWRRFAAIVYDTIALAAIWFFAALIVVILMKGEAVPSGSLLFTVYLLLAAFAYFGFCWTRSGQTLGMKSWKVILINDEAQNAVTWTQAGARFCIAMVSWALFGVGFLAAWVDEDNRTWHDRFSKTKLLNC
jgi:uncharacterized RDD family membrane protein YckC